MPEFLAEEDEGVEFGDGALREAEDADVVPPVGVGGPGLGEFEFECLGDGALEMGLELGQVGG